MKKVVLKSTTDFVLELEQKLNAYYFKKDKAFSLTVNYSNFLKQPLTFGMFIPCSLESGLPLNDNGLIDTEGYVLDEIEFKEYQEAKDRCIFEGFEVKHEKFIHDKLHFYIEHNGIKFMWNFNNKWEFYKEFSIIEDLVKYNLVLTESARKNLGL